MSPCVEHILQTLYLDETIIFLLISRVRICMYSKFKNMYIYMYLILSKYIIKNTRYVKKMLLFLKKNL